MRVGFPRILRPLFTPSRWKSIRGGRDGGKSWGVARALIEKGSADKHFIVCARETMESIKDSVYRLLVDQIEALGLLEQWQIEKQALTHRVTGTVIVFRGLKNPDALKSLEGATIVWIEEAQTVSAESWRKVPPTVRRDGSEIWLTWNPELETDPTWQKFVVHPPDSGLIEIVMNYTDNPWPSSVLDQERGQMQRDDPDEFQHVYGGTPKRKIAGAVYANELRLAEEQGRICKVPYHAGAPVRCGWDLGDSDIMAVWFIQSIAGQHRIIDYYENRHMPLDHYLEHCAAKGYRYAEDYFPWDAASKVLVGALETTMRMKGRQVIILPRQSRDVGIDAVREVLATSYFDLEKCADGLNRLRRYRFGLTGEIDPGTGQKSLTREPIHDDNCFHPHTQVLTRNGMYRIMDIGQNEEVLTPCGFRPCTPAKITQRNAPLVEVVFSDGSTVKCTPEHLFLTDKGWTSAEFLTSTSQILSPWTPLLCTLAAGYTDCGLESDIFRDLGRDFTAMCGLLRSARSRRGAIFTTGIPIASIIASKISNAFLWLNTFVIHGRSAAMLSPVLMQDLAPESGIGLQREDFGTGSTPLRQSHGSSARASKSRARDAALKLMRWSAKVAYSLRNSAQAPARPLRIVSVRHLKERVDTWCINVPSGHWFTLANGAVVHNSHGADALRSFAMGYRKPVAQDDYSHEPERPSGRSWLA